MRLWRKLFPYRGFLEEEIVRLRDQNALLLDRIILVTTGQPLAPMLQAQPELTAEEKKAVRAQVDEAANVEPFGGSNAPTFAQLLADMESKSFQDDALRPFGVDEVEEGASVVNAHAAMTEEDHQRELTIRKESQRAAARAQAEYIANARPVEVK